MTSCWEPYGSHKWAYARWRMVGDSSFAPSAVLLRSTFSCPRSSAPNAPILRIRHSRKRSRGFPLQHLTDLQKEADWLGRVDDLIETIHQGRTLGSTDADQPNAYLRLAPSFLHLDRFFLHCPHFAIGALCLRKPRRQFQHRDFLTLCHVHNKRDHKCSRPQALVFPAPSVLT
jgi:hypothetical protein